MARMPALALHNATTCAPAGLCNPAAHKNAALRTRARQQPHDGCQLPIAALVYEVVRDLARQLLVGQELDGCTRQGRGAQARRVGGVGWLACARCELTPRVSRLLHVQLLLLFQG